MDMRSKTKSTEAEPEDLPEHMLFFNLSIRKLAFVGVSFPLITLLTCLATAYVFQYDDVHETHCQVSKTQVTSMLAFPPHGDVTGLEHVQPLHLLGI